MEERWIKTICLYAALSMSVGCASSHYYADELPARYSAQSIRDYSFVDLTPYAKPDFDDETIQAGDRLEVNLNTGTLTEDADHVWPVSVDEAGTTSLPNIGAVKLAGLTTAEAAKAITRTSLERDVFLTPTVAVSVEERKERTILVSGAVVTPGPITIIGKSVSLADAIVRAGGLTSEASGQISVSGSQGRNDDLVVENALRAVGHEGGNKFRALTVSLDTTPPQQFGRIQVPEGAVVHVEEAPPRPIQVVGVIRDQAVEVPSGQDVRLLDALTLAGGQTYSNWISDRVTIIRRVPGKNETIRIAGSIRRAQKDDAENILLAPYDIVSVEENVLTFTLSTLTGFLGAGFNASRIAL